MVHEHVVTYISNFLHYLWRVYTVTTSCYDSLSQGASRSPLGHKELVQSCVVNMSEIQVIVKAGTKADLWPGRDYWNAKQLAAVRQSTEFHSTSASERDLLIYSKQLMGSFSTAWVFWKEHLATCSQFSTSWRWKLILKSCISSVFNSTT